MIKHELPFMTTICRYNVSKNKNRLNNSILKFGTTEHLDFKSKWYKINIRRVFSIIILTSIFLVGELKTFFPAIIYVLK